MTRTARTAALAALTALAALAAIIAADLTPPVQAQSEDETTGRIVARRLANGRVEFGWQPRRTDGEWGERVEPRHRYFPAPAEAEIGKWLRSSPVEVGGVELGRINARLRADGRIEFAFTPTGGERIAPPKRYFPASATVARGWLRSTEITIGPPAPRNRYIAVSAGGRHTCGLRESGEIECWGDNYWAERRSDDRIDQSIPPTGSFSAITAGPYHNCAIRKSDSAIECWGKNWDLEVNYNVPVGHARRVKRVINGATDAPAGRFTTVSAGNSHSCGLREDKTITCWGRKDNRVSGVPPGYFTAISASGGESHNCAIRASGDIACWAYWENREAPAAPSGSYTTVDTGRYHSCGLRDDGAILCWGGGNSSGETDAPAGSYSAVSASANGWHSCGLRESGEITCWGSNLAGETDAPDGRFTAVSAGGRHTCGLRESGEIECWGDNYYGQSTPPD